MTTDTVPGAEERIRDLEEQIKHMAMTAHGAYHFDQFSKHWTECARPFCADAARLLAAGHHVG